jgi:uncharacterized membrane protein (UPF0127 family)
MNRRVIVIFIVFGLILSTSGITGNTRIPDFPKGKLKIYDGDKELIIPIEIANRPELWSFGLMFREDIPWEYGMLFIFPNEESGGFWMKNTYIPLDIAFIDSDKTIFSIQRMLPCSDDNCPIYYSPKPYRYALEVKAGFFERFGFKEGSKIKVLF